MMRERFAYWRWLWRQRQWWFLRPLPPEWDTVIFTGFRGAGKSTFGADLCVNYMRAGIQVYSNMYVRDNFTGQEARPVLTWLDVLRASVEALEDKDPAIIYLAEIQLMCDARRWQDTMKEAPWWSEMMQQARHMGITIMGDTQHLSQVEKRLRMLIGRVVYVEPAPLRRLWRRWPRFTTQDVDLQVNDDPGQWLPPGKRRTVWLKSHAFHGHSTWELLAGRDFGEFTEPDVIAEIESLRQRALACNAIAHLPSYADDRPADRGTEGFFPRPLENGAL